MINSKIHPLHPKRIANTILNLIFKKVFNGVEPGIWIVNFIFQRILGINGEIKWMVHYTSRVWGNITIGKNVKNSFASSGGCYIQGQNGIEIGEGTIFAPNVSIISANHNLNNHYGHQKSKSIRIGNNCWIGAGVTILPGVKLGDNVIVGAGAVVTKSFGDNVIIGGIPARVIKKLEI